MAVTTTPGERRLLIDGKLVDAAGGGTFDNVNPATEEVLGPVADGTAADMEAAVAAARRAFDTTGWATDHAFRQALPAASCRPPSRARSRSCGPSWSPRSAARSSSPTARSSTPRSREALTWPAEMIDSFPWRRDSAPRTRSGWARREREVWKEPIGVVGVIVPWNFPVEITLNKLGPVLAMGNTCVLKPAPDTPWNATRLGRLIAEQTDIPPGVVNVVTSSDHLVGEVLTTSPLVDMVAFTGSTATGRRVMEAASATLKPVFLELGGKSVNLVLDDADLEAVVPGASTVCIHGGPGLRHPHPAARPPVPLRRGGRPRRRRASTGVTYGDPTDPSNLQGPLVSAPPARAGARLHRAGKAEGARLVVRRRRPAHLPTGLVRRADAVRRRRQLDDDRPGGDLRAGPRRDPLRGRRRRRAHRQRQPLRPVGHGHLRRPRPGQGRRPPHPHRDPRPSTAASGTAPTPRSAATSSRASAGSAASRASSMFTETKTVGWPA